MDSVGIGLIGIIVILWVWANWKKAGAPRREPKARKRTVGASSGAGCFLEALGLILLFVFPVGTIIGLALFAWGWSIARKTICSNCGNQVEQTSKICPTCGENL